MQLNFLVTLKFDGKPHVGDVQNHLYEVIEAARQNGQLSDELDEFVSCDDVEVEQQ